jgi:hypothetical protein
VSSAHSIVCVPLGVFRVTLYAFTDTTRGRDTPLRAADRLRAAFLRIMSAILRCVWGVGGKIDGRSCVDVQGGARWRCRRPISAPSTLALTHTHTLGFLVGSESCPG